MSSKLYISLMSLSILFCLPVSSFSQMYTGSKGWYKGNTHMHTTRSDGEISPNEAAQLYHDNDYDYIVITDHRKFVNGSSVSVSQRRTGFLIVSGEEFNSLTGYEPNHTTVMNSTDVLGDIDNNYSSKWEFYNKIYNLAISKGALPFINHPNWLSLITADDFLKIQGFKHFELFNACQDTDNYGIYGTGMPSVEQIWDDVLTRGGKYYGVGSDDTHNYSAPGACNPFGGWTMLKTNTFDVDGIITAYEQGDIYTTNGVILLDISDSLGLYSVNVDTASTLYELHRRDSLGYVNPARPVKKGTTGFKIEFIGPDGEIIETTRGGSAAFQVTNEYAYVRARVTYTRTITAATAPYDDALGQDRYVSENNLTMEEYYAWGQPFFTDKRRNGPALVFGCMDSSYFEYNEKVNVSDSTACKTMGISIRQNQNWMTESGKGYIYIKFHSDVKPGNIVLSNIAGKIIRKIDNKWEECRIEGLSAGIYFLTLHINNNKVSKRLVVY
ncbi:MAG: CehA/McbA family metallohydrolase [Fibrobacteria bacterium]|nr:CehA/McbA family metallohydrolase [Fibrobacteria bacterium]